MTTDQIFIVVTAIVASLLGAGAVLAALRRRDAGRGDEEAAITSVEATATDKYEARPAHEEAVGGASYGTAVRVLWWVSIALILIGVGVADAFGPSQPAIYALGAAAVAVVVLVHDLLPRRLRTVPVSVIEVLAALVLIAALLMLTGYGTSPFVYAFSLVAVAVALASGGVVAEGVAALATLAFLGVLWLDPALETYGAGDLLRFGLAIGSIWLLAYVAGVFASAERRMRAAVLNLSRIDPLTGLFNRGQLYPMLEQEVQRTRRSERGFCLLMIDLDGLKAVNDSYGHHRGDEVLTALGGVIRRSIRTIDNAYRLGGDEFLVLLPETDFVGAFVVAEKIRAGAEEVGFTAGDGQMLTSVSIGLVSCPEDGTSADDLMIAADRAMYQAKSLGKNQVSGNPRPRRLTYRPPAPERPVAPEPVPAVTAVPIGEEPEPAAVATDEPPARQVAMEAAAAAAGYAPDEMPAVGVPIGGGLPLPDRPSVVLEPLDTNHVDNEDEPDPGEVRRHIASAQRNLDPDYQIRRAMDAFLSPARPNSERD